MRVRARNDRTRPKGGGIMVIVTPHKYLFDNALLITGCREEAHGEHALLTEGIYIVDYGRMGNVCIL